MLILSPGLLYIDMLYIIKKLTMSSICLIVLHGDIVLLEQKRREEK